MALTYVELDPQTGGNKIRTDLIGGNDLQVIKTAFGAEGDENLVSAGLPLPVGDEMGAIGEGLVTGKARITKWGRNPDVDTAAAETVWEVGGLYTKMPAGAQTIDFVSTSGSDTGTIEVYGIDNSDALAQETLTLLGLSTATTVGQYKFLYRAHSISAALVGTVTGTGSTDTGTTVMQLSPGIDNSLMAVYLVPAGKTLYLQEYHGSIHRSSPSGASFDMELRQQTFSGTWATTPSRVIHTLGGSIEGETAPEQVFPIPISIAAGEFIELRVDVTDNNSIIGGGFSGYLKDD